MQRCPFLAAQENTKTGTCHLARIRPRRPHLMVPWDAENIYWGEWSALEWEGLEWELHHHWPSLTIMIKWWWWSSLWWLLWLLLSSLWWSIFKKCRTGHDSPASHSSDSGNSPCPRNRFAASPFQWEPASHVRNSLRSTVPGPLRLRLLVPPS